MTTAEKIKRIREEKKLTQSELGIRSGLDEMAIWQYESGRQIPEWIAIEKIADSLSVPMYYLLSDEAIQTLKLDKIYGLSQGTNPDPKVGSETQRILAALAKMNQTGKSEAAKRVEEMLCCPQYCP